MCLMLIIILYEYVITVNLYRSIIALEECQNNMQRRNKQTNKCIYNAYKQFSALLALGTESSQTGSYAPYTRFFNDQAEAQIHCHHIYSKEMSHSIKLEYTCIQEFFLRWYLQTSLRTIRKLSFEKYVL
jgi:hypothetical protein